MSITDHKVAHAPVVVQGGGQTVIITDHNGRHIPLLLVHGGGVLALTDYKAAHIALVLQGGGDITITDHDGAHVNPLLVHGGGRSLVTDHKRAHAGIVIQGGGMVGVTEHRIIPGGLLVHGGGSIAEADHKVGHFAALLIHGGGVVPITAHGVFVPSTVDPDVHGGGVITVSAYKIAGVLLAVTGGGMAFIGTTENSSTPLDLESYFLPPINPNDRVATAPRVPTTPKSPRYRSLYVHNHIGQNITIPDSATGSSDGIGAGWGTGRWGMMPWGGVGTSSGLVIGTGGVYPGGRWSGPLSFAQVAAIQAAGYADRIASVQPEHLGDLPLLDP